MKRTLLIGWLSIAWLLPPSAMPPPASMNGCVVASPMTADAVDPRVARPASLDLVARVFFGWADEEVVPVETDFYLLDRSLIEILKSTGLRLELSGGAAGAPTDEEYLEAAAKALDTNIGGDAETDAVVFTILEALEPHRRATVKTNRFGRGKTKRQVKTGNYFLFGVARIEGEMYVWHLPMTIKPGSNEMEINQDDSEIVVSTGEAAFSVPR